MKFLQTRLSMLFFLTIFLYCSENKAVNSSTPIIDEPSQSTKILFIGNSLTSYHNMTDMVKHLAEANGKEVSVSQQIALGRSLYYHASDPITYETIESKKWDFVVLQQSEGSIIDEGKHDQLLVPVNKIKEAILRNNPQTKIIYFLDFGFKTGIRYGGYFYSFSEFQELMNEGTKKFADALNMIIAPVGTAMNKVLTETDIEIFDWDNAHPSRAGSYLQACIYYSTIFCEGVHPNSYTGGVAQGEAIELQLIASDIVMNNLSRWNNNN